MAKQQADGYKIVLTADRTLMSEYNGIPQRILRHTIKTKRSWRL